AMFLYALSFSASLLWIVSLINSMNFIDGLDGLAGGIAFIASAAFFALAAFKPSDTMMSTYVSVFIATVTAIFGGSLLGFLFYNVKPAKIFMGDGGSMFLGLMLSSLALIGSYKGLTAIMFFTPVLLLSVPIFDIVFAVVRRKLNGVPISKADKSHLHHRLLALGLTPLQSVFVLWGVAVLFSVFAYLLV
ncbi:MAG: MraY family glycosyltransferase, partial [Candidatus Firestonebacteria bacterium]